ncbi:SEN1 N terminal-domain-containing protein [Xylariomycetidae sp. FL2044]|nr:SEN1 N terminal-domain-containing protein [Xylariomycetidae sp. FL2044]
MDIYQIIDDGFRELHKFPNECHLFCPKFSEADEEDYNVLEDITPEKKQRIQDGKERTNLMYRCSLILGLESPQVEAPRRDFENRSAEFLGNCPHCVRSWHKGRKPFLKWLLEKCDEHIVAAMEARLNEFDFRRITRGLEKAQEFIESRGGSATQGTFIKEDKTDLLIALYESICCMPYLSLPENRRPFNYVFERIQRKKPLKLEDILPVMTFFLFDENPIRNAFAVQAFKSKPSISEEDFEWAIDRYLSDAILKANDVKTSSHDSLLRFWQGFSHILEALDENLVIHSLRGMSVQPSIYELLLAQMGQVNSVAVLRVLIEIFCALMRKSRKAFWNAYGHYSPASVAEQILRSPAYRLLLSQSEDYEPSEDIQTDLEVSELAPAAISWIKPFIESIPTSQKTDLCEKLLHHLLQDFAKDKDMSPEGRDACHHGAAEALSSTLGSFLSPDYKFDILSSTIHTNAVLNLTLQYKDVIIQLAQHQIYATGLQRTASAQAGLSVINQALRLDSRITLEEFRVLHSSDRDNSDGIQTDVKRDSAGLWSAFLGALKPGSYDLARSMLIGMLPLLTVEALLPLKRDGRLSPVKSEFNREMRKTAGVVGRMINELEYFDSSAVSQLLSDRTASFPIVASLLYGEDAVSDAGISLIKYITDEVGRGGALQSLLQSHFGSFLRSYTRATEKIVEERQGELWSPQLKIINSSRDILDSLCDPSSGLLRSKELSDAEQAILVGWWQSQWTFINSGLQQVDGWSKFIDVETMKNFARTQMEYMELLLSQDGVMASALSSRSIQNASSNDGSDSSTNLMKAVLEPPRSQCYGLCMMLRLKDPYLIELVVKVLGKMLRRFVEFGMGIQQSALTFIRRICTRTPNGTYSINSNLTERQRAELIRALGEDSEEVQFMYEKKAEPQKRQTKLDSWSRSAKDTPSRPSSPILSTTASIPKQKPAIRSGKDDIRELLQSSSTDKNRATLDKIKARQATKLPPPPPVSSVASIKEKRAKEAAEKKKRDAEAIARAKALRAPKQTVTGEGSGLRGVSGVQGKDHAPHKSEILVNSSSEDEDDSDDDAEFLARTGAGRKGTEDSKGIQSIKHNLQGPVKKIKIQRSAKDMRARLIPPMDVLHQAILEWDIFHEGNDPPNGITCSRVGDTYGDPSQYKQTFFPLLVNEAWRSFKTAKDEAVSKPFGVKVVNRMSVDKFIEVSTAMPLTNNKDRFLSEGDIVLFSLGADPLEAREDLHCLARIWRVQFKNGSLEVQYRLSGRAGPMISSMVPQAEFYAVKITNMTTIEREYASLESLQYFDLMPEILEAKPSPMLKFSQQAIDDVMQKYQLNPGQAKAILGARANDAFTLIQGPPGTGKTKTIVAMVGALMTGTFSSNGGTAIKRPDGLGPSSKGTSKKLLVCAPSNAAVDELVLRLKAGVKSMNGSFHKINVLRLGRSEAINAAVRDVTLDELVKARVEGDSEQNRGPSSRELMHREAGQIKSELGELRPQLEAARVAGGDRTRINQLQRKFDELKRRQAHIGTKIDADKDSGNTTVRENELKRRKYQQEILDSAQVLCATLSGSGHEMFKNLAVEFETVIIDEAAQCVELSALIPLKYGCSKCILVGDPKQLPPTVLSQSAARFGYDQSLFVRMQRNHPDHVHLLDTQYRMHPEISMFPSQEFYERLLLDGGNMASLRQQPWHQSGLLGPYRFFDVKGIQQAGQKGQSLVNFEELKVAMQLYERFLADYPDVDLKNKIGIITPYKAQLYALREHFSRRYGDRIKDEIEFNTTDAFQGRECEIIIFSCVRASSTGGIGFMTDIRRMNVGLTRAKSSLWILGDSRALVQGEFWNKLIVDAKSRDRYTGGDVLSLLRKPGAKVPAGFYDQPSVVTALPSSLSISDGVASTRDGLAARTCSSTENSGAPTHHQVEDVIMTDAPSLPSGPLNRYKTPQLPQQYTVLERPKPFHLNNPTQPDFGGIDERGETSVINRSAGRPVIHQTGQKRPSDSADGDKPVKRSPRLQAVVVPCHF